MYLNSKRTPTITSEQKSELIEFIEKHPELKSGKFSNNFTFKDAQTLWIEITETLNAMPGAKKEWKLWRKTWQDLKVNAKRKNTLIKTHYKGTGGGPQTLLALTDTEEKIVDILGPVVLEGHPNVEESETTFIDEDIAHEVILDELVTTGHDYCTIDSMEQNNLSKEATLLQPNLKINSNKENIPSIHLDVKSCQQTVKDISSTKKKKTTRVGRLEHTITATDKLAQLTEQKIAVKEKYLDEKLKLLKEDIEVKKRVATALENITEALSELI